MMLNLYRKVAEEMNIPVEVVEFAYKSYWKFIRKTIQELPLKENLSEEEFAKLKTNFKRKNHTEISRRPRPTTVKPITLPAEKAMRRPLFNPSRQAFAVRAFASVAIFIPIKPERAEKKPPVTKAKGT